MTYTESLVNFAQAVKVERDPKDGTVWIKVESDREFAQVGLGAVQAQALAVMLLKAAKPQQELFVIPVEVSER